MSRIARLPALPALAVLAALALSCDEEATIAPTPPAVGVITGSVHQRLHPEVPLAGATLTWGDASATSAADGSYELEPGAAGADSLRVGLAGFAGESRWVELGEADQQQSFTLLPYDITPPPAPLAFTLTSVEGRFLRLAWTAPADSSDLAGYWLTKSPGDPQAQHFGIEVNSWLDIAVTSDRDYSYTLASIDPSGNLSAPLSVAGAVDALPNYSRLTFVPTGGYSELIMRWTANLDDDFASYRLYRGEGAGSADSLDLLVFTSEERADTSFTDTDLLANAVYSYRLYTLDAAGQATSPAGFCLTEGAAQRFAGLDGEDRLLILPTLADRFLLADAIGGRLLLVDAAGIAQDSLALAAAPNASATLPDGRLWLSASGGGQATLSLLDTDPLSLVREGTVSVQPGALAWLGGDSLVLAPFAGGAPVLYDALSFQPLDTLELLGDLAAASRLIADPAGKQLFVAETSGDLRLLQVDLGGAPAIVETATLAGPVHAFGRDGAGHLLVATLGTSALRRYAEGDFADTQLIELGSFASAGRFSSDGGEWWARPVGQGLVRGYALDWDGAAALVLDAFAQIDPPQALGRLEPGGVIVSLLSSNLVSLCDPARGGTP